MNKKSVVSVSGFGWSGSGAVVDLLREYEDVDIVDSNGSDFECTFLYNIYKLDLLLNQFNSRLSSSDAIKEFRENVYFESEKRGFEEVFNGKYKQFADEYLNSIVDFSLCGWTFRDIQYPLAHNRWKNRYNWLVDHFWGNRLTGKLALCRSIKKKMFLKVSHKMEVSYNPVNFDDITRRYIDRLLREVHPHPNNPLILDQGFPPDRPDMFFKYLDCPKCIVVRRDPRDIYLLAKCAISYMAVPLPISNVDDFIRFYKKVIKGSKVNDTENILSINFEDLIFEYSKTVEKIEKFLGISKHMCPRTKFHPDVSVNNVNLKHRYKMYAKDINKIEIYLSDSLYPFEKYNIKRTDQAVF